jgi:putative flippase GtrA
MPEPLPGRAPEGARPPLAVQVVRFALVGAGRTAVSLGLYLALTLVVPYWAAFTIAFVAGVTFSAIVSGRYVFLVGLTVRGYLLYATVYLSNYLISLGFLVLFVEWLGVPDYLAPVPVILCMFPINFVAERYVLVANARRPDPAS